MKLRPILYGFLALPLVLAGLASWGQRAADNDITVYKTPTCGCCTKWVDHLKENGFQVTVHEVEDTTEYSRQHGVPDSARSCHLGVVGGYAIEGHVPAAEIQRLLKERPKAKGLAVPGMPIGYFPGGSPGRYAVVMIGEDGKTSVYQQYPRN
ncbi:MAG: metal-binding protein [Acidobacteria bacterium]|nr:metal-binding protein [Acidobacteriota bacterium]